MLRILAISACLFLTAGACASTTFYSDLNAFNAASANLDLYDFFGNRVDAGRLIIFDGGTGSYSARDASFANDPRFGDGPSITGAGTTHRFALLPGITAFGIDIFDLGTVGVPSTLSVVTSSGAEFTLQPSFMGEVGNRIFAGITSTEEITSVTFLNSISGDILGFDNLLRGTAIRVPEPATWLMMIIGFAGVGFMAKRRRRLEIVR